MPIVIERDEYEIAYVCEDINNDKNDSFLVLLTRFNGEGKYPYLLKFTKTADGKYWKIPQDKVCNTTVIQGLTWDFLKQNAMAENDEGRRGEWWNAFAELVEKNPEDKAMLAALKGAQKEADDAFRAVLEEQIADKSPEEQKSIREGKLFAS